MVSPSQSHTKLHRSTQSLVCSGGRHYHFLPVQRVSREYPSSKDVVVVEWKLSCADRAHLRKSVAAKWAEEEPFTNYRYNVECCSNGKRVYLLRPTWLNKGFDFGVNVEGLIKVVKPGKGGTREMPSHEDVIHDLRQKITQLPENAQALFDGVVGIYSCAEPHDLIEKHTALVDFTVGWPVDQSLLTLKWLFIEQDVTYWLQRGRDMLMSAIERDVFNL